MSNRQCEQVRLRKKLEQCLLLADELEADVTAIRIGEALEALAVLNVISEIELRHFGDELR